MQLPSEYTDSFARADTNSPLDEQLGRKTMFKRPKIATECLEAPAEPVGYRQNLSHNRANLEKYIVDGKRPVYGFPHLCFDENLMLHDPHDEKHIKFWKIISRSILKK